MADDVWRSTQIPLVTSLVTTVDKHGRANASPKSWWTPVSYQPPMLVLSVKPESDTAWNLLDTGEFVLHVPQQHFAEKVLHTAKRLPYGECELDDVGLPWEWIDGEDGLKLPCVVTMPWLRCTGQLLRKAAPFDDADHDLWLGTVVDYDPQDATWTKSVLLHRGRNTFVEVGDEYTVTPY